MIYVLSGGGKAYAVIHVDYPVGAVCTCTKGTKTLKAKDTSGMCNFLIPEAGTWTVTASNGTQTKSIQVLINAEGQSESVDCSFAFVLFDKDNGVNVTSNRFTGDHFEVNATDGIKIYSYYQSTGDNIGTRMGYSRYVPINPNTEIVRGNFSTLNAIVIASNNSFRPRIQILRNSNDSVIVSATASGDSSSLTTLSVDITNADVPFTYSIDGNYAGNYPNVCVHKVWLS